MRQLKALLKDAGGPSAVAGHFQITPQAVYKWFDSGVPAERVVGLCALAKGKWIPQQVRPDIFGPAPQKEAA